jgi:MoxR-like ATPase
LEQAGTYPLPEAQLDRFLLHIRVDYPSQSEERDILIQTTGSKSSAVPKVMAGAAVRELQKMVRDVHVSEDLLDWINRLVRASRPQQAVADIATWVKWGAGPRAGQALVLCAKARALIHGRLAATREDIEVLAAPVMRHRLLLTFLADAEGKSADDVVSLLLAAVPSPN